MLKLVFCFGLLLYATYVAANYNFHDPDFNQMLFHDITSELNDKTLRSKRDVGSENEVECNFSDFPKEEVNDIHCCMGEKGNRAVRRAANEAKKMCFAEIRGQNGPDDDEISYDPLSCEGIQVIREKSICAAECIAKNLDLIDASGTFKRDLLVNHTRELLGESKWKSEMLEKYVDDCLNSLEIDGKMRDKLTCDPRPLEYHYCIWKKLIEGCPSESQIENKKCRKIRERLRKGDNSHAQKFFRKLFNQ